MLSLIVFIFPFVLLLNSDIVRGRLWPEPNDVMSVSAMVGPEC